MAKQRNVDTDSIRQCVKSWLSNTNQERFTVLDICDSLSYQFEDLDIVKYVSNELLRLQKVGILDSVQGCRSGTLQTIGRPPRCYFKLYNQDMLTIVKGFK